MSQLHGRAFMQERSAATGLRTTLSRFLQVMIEGLILVIVCFAPWAYGCVHAGFEYLLDAGVFLLSVLWGVRILVEGSITLHKCPVTLCLAGLFLLGVWQTTPLGGAILEGISPATARWYHELLPTTDEEIVAAGEAQFRSPGVGATISVYRYATRHALQRILAVLLVFLVVRYNLNSSSAFRRFAVLVLANGACLALFGIVQFLSSPRDLLYWSVPSGGMQVFGPFVYRNHYACYMNLCIGMGLGLLWTRRNLAEFGASGMLDPAERKTVSNTPRRLLRVAVSMVSEPLTAFFRLLHDPASLWICAALALMASSIVFTLSRGGFMALVGGFVACFLVQIASSTRFLRFGTALVGVGMMVGILGWFGLATFEERYATLWSGNALGESRLPLWRAAWSIIADFPIWGTGFGTYQYIDPLYRRSAEVADLTVDHVHNDHLEMLVEGGVIGLVLMWGVLGLIFVRGFRAFRSGSSAGGLALGAIFSGTTLVLHEFGDFLVSVPAIALLATVIFAHLSNLGQRAKGSDGSIDSLAPVRQRIASVLASILVIALGFLVMNEGRRVHAADSLRQATYQGDLRDRKAGFSELQRRKEILAAAVQMTPEDADLRRELADTDADLFRQQRESMRARDAVVENAIIVLLSAPSGPCQWADPVAILPFLRDSNPLRRENSTAEEVALAQQFLTPALKNYVQARNAAPLLPEPQLGLALLADRMPRAEPAQIYMNRVKLLAPADPTFWYFCGNQELRMGHPEQAWKSWRRSLELSDRYLLEIAERGKKLLGIDGLIDMILPDRPTTLAEAASKLYPRSNQAEDRRPFLLKALRLLDAHPERMTTQDLRTKASVCQALGRFEDAVRIYRDLLEKEPMQIPYRFELAQALFQEGLLEQSQAELAIILSQQHNHAKAYDLWTRITNDLMRRK
jgi:O-antigen ligase/tetratricopeptide (TPR) repeat protein